MPRACSICTHGQTATISKDLLAGGSLQRVADRFNVAKASLGRHLRNCLRTVRRAEQTGSIRKKTVPVGLSRFENATDPKTLIRRAEMLLDDALEILAQAKSENDARLGLQAVRECRSSLELLMKAHGMLAPDTTVNVNIDSRKQVLTTLSRFSESELRAIARGEPLAALTAK